MGHGVFAIGDSICRGSIANLRVVLLLPIRRRVGQTIFRDRQGELTIGVFRLIEAMRRNRVSASSIQAIVIGSLRIYQGRFELNSRILSRRTILSFESSRSNVRGLINLHRLDSRYHRVIRLLYMLSLYPLVLSIEGRLHVVLCEIVVSVGRIFRIVRACSIILLYFLNVHLGDICYHGNRTRNRCSCAFRGLYIFIWGKGLSSVIISTLRCSSKELAGGFVPDLSSESLVLVSVFLLD